MKRKQDGLFSRGGIGPILIIAASSGFCMDRIPPLREPV
jgi:hypothetical protein